MFHSDLLMFPSRYEGMPNVLIEAFSVGLPVIASNIASTRHIVGDKDCVAWFSPNDKQAFLSKVRSFMDNPRGSIEKADAARRLSDRFSVDKMCERYARAYEAIL